jgi:hypothetical protein
MAHVSLFCNLMRHYRKIYGTPKAVITESRITIMNVHVKTSGSRKYYYLDGITFGDHRPKNIQFLFKFSDLRYMQLLPETVHFDIAFVIVS